MLKPIIPALCSLSLGVSLVIGFVNHSNAQGKADFNQPIQISSDNNSFDLQSNLAIYETNVVIRQGTLEIKANRLTAQRDRDRAVETFIATGEPATYQQTLDDGSPIVAQAREIQYDQLAQTLTLAGAAELSQNDSVIRADRIVYDFANQQLRTERAENSDDQVTTIFMPRPRNDDSENEENPPTNNEN